MVTNDSLRFEISNYYGYEIHWVLDHNIQNKEWNMQNVYPKFFEEMEVGEDTFIESDIEHLKSSHHFNNLWEMNRKYYIEGGIWRLNDLIPKTEKLLDNLNQEIKRLENL